MKNKNSDITVSNNSNQNLLYNFTKNIFIMKKIITFSIIVLGTMFVNAQTKEEIQKSQERYEKILKLETPKSTSISSLDELTVNVGATAVESANITPLLQNLYYRSIGETKDGVSDVTVKKPSLDECKELATRILSQTEKIQNLTSLLSNVTNDTSNIKNPLKLPKILSSVNYAKTAISLLGEETVFQANAIKNIISTLSTGNNL